jgi:hypothetical protein
MEPLFAPPDPGSLRKRADLCRRLALTTRNQGLAKRLTDLACDYEAQAVTDGKVTSLD